MSAAASRSGPAHGHDRRRHARMAAVQALYQVEVGEGSPRAVIAEFVRHRLAEDIDGLRLGEVDRTLFAELVEQVWRRRGEFDDIIAAVLDADWQVERLERLLRLILRCGVYELAQRTDIPAPVVMNEYVELARAFFGGKEPAMVNGVLDRLARELRFEDLEPAPETDGIS